MSLDPGVLQAALLQVADATKAAVAAAQSAGSQAAASSAKPGAGVDWSKLLNKPNIFDNKTAEEDIRSFRDWHWQLCQYLIAVDEGFAGELKQINDDPSKQLVMESASAETR